MFSQEEFSERLKKIMEVYGLSARAFADRISVPASSISHLLSGRNKPSLEFILKTLEAYPKIPILWLVKGEGEFPSGSSPLTGNTSTSSSEKPIERIVVFYTDGSFSSHKPA